MTPTLYPYKPGYKIIHAEDQKLFRQLLGSQINAFDEFNVIEQVDNGLQLIELITKGLIPDIVLLDINMPEMDGYETARWLKKNHPAIKIIVFTIFANEHVKAQAIQCGADAVISKNVDLKDLRHLLENLVTENATANFHQQDLLTGRQLKLLQLMCTDLTYRTIAKKMGISYRLVERTREDLFEKFKTNNRTSMVLHALKKGIITGFYN